MPNARTPRELLLTALDQRQLTGYRASRDLAWVIFPPSSEGGTRVEVIHLARINRFRVVSSHMASSSTAPAATLGDFRRCEDAAACVEEALSGAPARNGYAEE